MKEVYEFLKNSNVFYLATMDNNKPKVRPFGALNIYDDKLYLITNRTKNVAKQILNNPNISISSMYNGKWLRLEGTLVNDDRIEAKENMLNNNPDLKAMYNANDINTMVLYLKDVKATICSFTDEPIIIEF